jgi:hypothetical protein
VRRYSPGAVTPPERVTLLPFLSTKTNSYEATNTGA